MIRLCPRCGNVYSEAPALSRVDGKTDICPGCGTAEALEAFKQFIEKRQIINYFEISEKAGLSAGPCYLEFKIECDVPIGAKETNPPPEFSGELLIGLALDMGIKSEYIRPITREEYLEKTEESDR